ncbi:MAG: ATP-binding cassette domain-containing protein [Candidatus Hodarchaeales archaeon]|jgi:ABC-2 type transport system ATP-binding protein
MAEAKSGINVLQVEGLTKHYGREYYVGSRKVSGEIVKAVKDVSFAVRKGEIFGFLGPNGAGKSTTMRAIMDYLKLQGGSIKIFGLDYKKDVLAIRKRIGYLPGDVALYNNFTGLELIEYFGKFRPIDEEMFNKLRSLFKVNLKQKIGSLSSGNRQQVAVFTALVSNPDLLILDEPTGGLDPLMAARLHKLLIELRDQGKTIFLSSHDLTEVQKVCDRVGIIREGQMVVIEKVETLLEKSLQALNIEFEDVANTPSEADFRAISNVISVQKKRQNNKFHLKIKEDVNDLLKFLTNFRVKRLTLTDASLEEIFLHYYAAE